jgi:hypothetical protein
VETNLQIWGQSLHQLAKLMTNKLKIPAPIILSLQYYPESAQNLQNMLLSVSQNPEYHHTKG